MRIIAFSDTHGKQNKTLTKWFNDNPADLLIFAGDLQFNQFDDNGIDFLKWFNKLPYPLKILVFGNHDGHYKSILQYKEDNKLDNIFILTDTTANIPTENDVIKIYGSPHSVQYGRWWFMMRDEELKTLWKQIPDDIDILITHGPPYNIMDYTCDNIHVGSLSLSERISKLGNLKYHIFGHIHESHGIRNIDGITYMNVSLANERYQIVNNPIIFDYDSGIVGFDYNVGE